MSQFVSFVDYESGFQSASQPNSQSTANGKKLSILQYNTPFFKGEIECLSCSDCYFAFQFATPLCGRVVCTNARLRFISNVPQTRRLPRRSRFYEESCEFPLCSIHSIHVALVKDASRNVHYSQLTENISSLDVVSHIKIILKDFRVISIDLRRSQNGTALANQLLFFAKHPQVGPFPLTSTANQQPKEIVKFFTKTAWMTELHRCCSVGEGNWRIVDLHKEIIEDLSENYPPFVVAPSSFSMTDIDRLARNAKLGRFPIWVWSYSSGSALMISSKLEEHVGTPMLMSRIFDGVAQSHSKDERPEMIHLDDDFQAQVTKGYEALKRLCAIDSHSQYAVRERHWLSRVWKTGWTQLVTNCMQKTAEALNFIVDRNRSVILTENESRDAALVIGSLVQICADAHYRTVNGLYELIDKMWLSLGHPFGIRLYGNDATICPTWLLFLDCLAQLIRIYPTQFAYSSHLLLGLFDASISGASRCFFSAFSPSVPFDSPFPLDQFFYAEFTMLFTNMYHQAAKTVQNMAMIRRGSSSFLMQEVIRTPICTMDIELWEECYMRWTPPASVNNAGLPRESSVLDSLMCNIAESRRGITWQTQLPAPERLSSLFPYCEPDGLQRIMYSKIEDEDGSDDTVSVASMASKRGSFPNDNDSNRVRLSPSDSSASFRAQRAVPLPPLTNMSTSASLPTPNHINPSSRPRAHRQAPLPPPRRSPDSTIIRF
ncbi:hypothetical protein WR25_21988 [Diploscapter pachys]|uniref:Myotubularin phosphatase domain-containing protein n=1 Tax=Diploscapter pachys TaxID=2018661 RepID=A0A2A2L976_9BILA|nr:hypothetical protein WR25_21988 [Diploscapter pachys]